jgi:hypothetical protein
VGLRAANAWTWLAAARDGQGDLRQGIAAARMVAGVDALGRFGHCIELTRMGTSTHVGSVPTERRSLGTGGMAQRWHGHGRMAYKRSSTARTG